MRSLDFELPRMIASQIEVIPPWGCKSKIKLSSTMSGISQIPVRFNAILLIGELEAKSGGLWPEAL
mgnify:CR=1 FL=1